MTTIYIIGNGTGAFTPPSTVSATVETWAAGAGGASNNFTSSSSAAGGGGGYSAGTVSLTAGTPIPFTLGAPGAGETASVAAQSGGATFFNGTTLAGSSVGANGGKAITTGTTGGAGGSTTGAIGTTTVAGGAGGNGQVSGGGAGGGGAGGAAGSGVAGTAGVTGNVTGSVGGAGDNGAGGAGGSGQGSSVTPTGKAGTASYLGGGGGQGGYAGLSATNGGTGGAGAFPGGGGGGGGTNANNGTLGGAGGASLIAITYASADPDQIYALGSLGTVLIPSSWTANAIAEGWGGGGSGGAGGATGSGGSGGGGGYSKVNTLSVSAGGTLAVTVGGAGVNTSIGASLVANRGVNGTAGAGGAGGAGGAAGTGDVANAGGAGVSGITGTDGGGGGGAAGSAGGVGGAGNTGTTVTGGNGGSSPSAGAGGAGSALGAGTAGTADSRGGGGGGGGGIGTTVQGGAAGWPGGGGGAGGHGTTATGGVAAAGLIVLTKIATAAFTWQQLATSIDRNFSGRANTDTNFALPIVSPPAPTPTGWRNDVSYNPAGIGTPKFVDQVFPFFGPASTPEIWLQFPSSAVAPQKPQQPDGSTAPILVTAPMLPLGWRNDANYNSPVPTAQLFNRIVDSATEFYLYDFTTTIGTIPSGTIFTRASTATYFNSSGVLSTAAVNAARFDYDPVLLTLNGLLDEPARTNMVGWSQDFSQTKWVLGGVTYSPSGILSPDGVTFFSTLIQNSSNVRHGVTQNLGFAVKGTSYSTSCYIKYDGTQWVQLLAWTGAVTLFANFDILNGVVGLSSAAVLNPSVQSIGNGIYRISFDYLATVSSGTLQFVCNMMQSNAAVVSPTFTGDGVSGFYIWGAQYEIGANPSSYIPTLSAATATRAKDSLTITVPPNLSTLYICYDDASIQKVPGVPAGAYTIGADSINRPWLRGIFAGLDSSINFPPAWMYSEPRVSPGKPTQQPTIPAYNPLVIVQALILGWRNDTNWNTSKLPTQQTSQPIVPVPSTFTVPNGWMQAVSWLTSLPAPQQSYLIVGPVPPILAPVAPFGWASSASWNTAPFPTSQSGMTAQPVIVIPNPIIISARPFKFRIGNPGQDNRGGPGFGGLIIK